jgi:P-type Cu+ transporter
VALNISGLIHIRTTAVGNDTGLARIIKLVEDAQSSKPDIQRFADRISGIFVPVVLCLSLMTFTFWMSACWLEIVPENWIHQGSNPFQFSLLFAISVIVIACPCALGLATPTAVMVGTGMGALHGVLIKGGKALELACKVTAVIFDKTGTLTEGKLQIDQTIIYDAEMNEEQFFSLLGSVERGNNHPIAQCLVAHAETLQCTFVQPLDSQNLPGYGIQCSIGEKRVFCGNQKLLEQNSVLISDAILKEMQLIEQQGKTVIILAIENSIVGLVSICDSIKLEALCTVKELQARGIEVWMVTGDNRFTAHSVAASLGIENVFAEVIPDQKLDKVRQLQSRGHVVAMVGDGINDSPALATADIGIAIGTGTDIAIDSADMVLVDNDLRNVVTALDLSRCTLKRIKINYVWALVYNILGIPLAAGVLVGWGIVVPPVIAGAAMTFSSISVVCSSLMLRNYDKPCIPIRRCLPRNCSAFYRSNCNVF